MKTIRTSLAGSGLLLWTALSSAQEQARSSVSNHAPAPTVAARPANGTTNSLRLNFRGAALETVLDYLSEAAGFVIVLEAQPHGTVDLWSEQPLTREEALDLLNSSLLKNGYAAIRKGRVLTIVNRDQAKTRALPVKLGNDPDAIPQSEELVTQILPIRFTEAAKLLPVLQPLVSLHTVMTANESANTLVVTDTQANIHRLAQVIQGVDAGAEDFTVVKVFHLRNANSSEMAQVLSQLFPDNSRSQAGGSPLQFGGFPGPPGGFGPPPFGGFGGPNAASAGAGNGTSDQARRLNNRAKVTAVPDERTQSVVVTASKDLMPQVEAVVQQLDANPKGKQELAVYQLKNASAQALAKVLQDAFQKTGTSNNRNSSTQTDALENRSTTQSQQNNSTSQTQVGRGAGGFGQGQGGGPGGGGLGP